MKRTTWLVVCLFILLPHGGCAIRSGNGDHSETKVARSLIEEGDAYHQKGDIERAAAAWEKALPFFNRDADSGIWLDTVVRLAGAYRDLGRHDRAIQVVGDAVPVVEKSEDGLRKATVYATLGDIYLCVGNMRGAVENIEMAARVADNTGNPGIQARVLNDIGNLFAARNRHGEAVAAYEKSLGISENDLAFHAGVRLNLIRSKCATGNYRGLSKEIGAASDQIARLPDNREKTMLLLSIGGLAYGLSKKDLRSKTFYLQLAFQSFGEARRIAVPAGDVRNASHASGNLGRLYEDEGKLAAATDMTRTAIFFAKQGEFPEILYVWQWQMGSLCAAKGDTDGAIDWYNRAITTLNPIRTRFFRGFRAGGNAFGEKVKPVYLALAGLLLEQADKSQGTVKEAKLRQARDAMELIKKAELENFYQDECVSVKERKTEEIDRVAGHTAIIYPIPFKDRLSVLADTPAGMRHYRAAAGSAEIGKTVDEFLELIRKWGDADELVKIGKKLHDWLIAPMREELDAQNIDTLVVAPDGARRLIPFAALYDGERFLVEKYAVVTVPAMTLTESAPIERKDDSILLSGLSVGKSESGMMFASLPGVPRELDKIETVMGGKTLLDEDYTVAGLTGELKNHEYTLVHMASHGIFGGSGKDSFILTYDGKMTMDQLEELILLGSLRENNINMLTLSACETAQGDERAAFGLAGIAVKAGVSSALATLWPVDDSATHRLMGEYYRQLTVPGTTKAQALRNAQIRLIEKPRFWHPAFWSPFLLIGNWN